MKSDLGTSNALIENISEENEDVKPQMESEVCVSIKDAVFAWPNSKVPVLTIDNLKIEEGSSYCCSTIFSGGYFKDFSWGYLLLVGLL